MDLFNRVIATVLILLLLLLALAIVFTAIFIPTQSIGAAVSLFSSLHSNVNLFSQAIVAIIAGILAIILFLALLLELNPKKLEGVQLTQVKGGSAVLSTESIIQRVRQAVETIPQVRRAEPTVHSHGKSLDLKLDLFLDSSADVPSKTEEAAKAARETVGSKLGVKINKVRIQVRHEKIQAVGVGSQGSGARS